MSRGQRRGVGGGHRRIERMAVDEEDALLLQAAPASAHRSDSATTAATRRRRRGRRCASACRASRAAPHASAAITQWSPGRLPKPGLRADFMRAPRYRARDRCHGPIGGSSNARHLRDLGSTPTVIPVTAHALGLDNTDACARVFNEVPLSVKRQRLSLGRFPLTVTCAAALTAALLVAPLARRARPTRAISKGSSWRRPIAPASRVPSPTPSCTSGARRTRRRPTRTAASG